MHLNDVLNKATILPWAPNSYLFLVLGWHEWRNTIQSLVNETYWIRLDQVALTSYNHNSGHKFLGLPAPNINKITIQDFIKYLLDTWKTKPFIRDHGSDRAQWLTPVCSLSSSQMLSSLASSGRLRSLHRQGACEDATVSPHLIQIRTALHDSFSKLRPGLGSYEGRSFICSSLQLRQERTAKLGLQDRNISPCEK